MTYQRTVFLVVVCFFPKDVTDLPKDRDYFKINMKVTDEA